MAGAFFGRTGGCFTTCLGVLLLLLFLPILFPALMIGLFIYLLVVLWQSSLSLRAKRLVTGFLIYPAGVYFLCRYTAHSLRVKAGVLAATVLATLLLAENVALGAPLLFALAAAYVPLFLIGAEPEPGRPRQRWAWRETSTPPVGRKVSDIPPARLRRLLEIERADSAAERRLLLAREFCRLASEALAVDPADRKTWPSSRQAALLRAEVDLLRNSAHDPVADHLPESGASGVPDIGRIRAAVQELANYAGALESVCARRAADLERVRALARDRGRLQTVHDEIVELLQAVTPHADASPPSEATGADRERHRALPESTGGFTLPLWRIKRSEPR